jgi:hypothetical protein
MDSVIQKRYFFGSAFIFWGMKFLKDRKRILYLLCVLIAVGIHFSFLLYIPFVLLDLIDEKKEKYVLTIVVLLELIILQKGQFIISMIFGSAKATTYFFETTYSSIWIGIIYAIAMAGYIYIVEKLTYQLVQTRTVEFVRKLNRISIIFIPMFLYESVYMRYYRIVLMWTYIIISNENDNYFIKNNKIRVGGKYAWVQVFVIYMITINLGIYCNDYYGIWGFIDTFMQNALLK